MEEQIYSNLIYNTQYRLLEHINNCLSALRDNEGTTVEEMLSYGFNNSYIKLSDCHYNIGYLNLDKSMDNYDFEYNKIKDLKVVLDDYEISDEGYYDITLRPLNEEEEKKFKEGLL